MFRVRVQILWRVPVVGSKLSTKQKRQKRGTFANGICEVKRALPLSILILLKPALSTELTEVLFRNRVWNTRSKVGGAERQWKLAQLVCLWSHCCFCVGECKLGQFDQATETSDEQTGTLSLISAAFHLSRCLFGPQWIVFYLISGRTRIRQTPAHTNQCSFVSPTLLRCREPRRLEALLFHNEARAHTWFISCIALIISAPCLPPQLNFPSARCRLLENAKGAVFFRIQRTQLKNGVFRCKIHKLFSLIYIFRGSVLLCVWKIQPVAKLQNSFHGLNGEKLSSSSPRLPCAGQCGSIFFYIYGALSATTVQAKNCNLSRLDCEKLKRCTCQSTWSAAAEIICSCTAVTCSFYNSSFCGK